MLRRGPWRMGAGLTGSGYDVGVIAGIRADVLVVGVCHHVKMGGVRQRFLFFCDGGVQSSYRLE